MDAVKRDITTNPGCTLKEIMLELNHHYASNSGARVSIRKALAEWEGDWCVVDTTRKEFRYSLAEEIHNAAL